MTDVRMCRYCKWSIPETNSPWSLECSNPKVMVSDIWLLANNSRNGASCVEERKLGWFSACGKSGKLWAAKEPSKEDITPFFNGEMASKAV